MSAAGADGALSYTHVWGDGTPAGRGVVESVSALAVCVECLRCRAGAGCEGQPRAPEDVKQKSDKIRLSFYRDHSGSSEEETGAS